MQILIKYFLNDINHEIVLRWMSIILASYIQKMGGVNIYLLYNTC